MTDFRAAADSVVFLNGAFMPADAACLPVGDPGVLFGFGFFETFRTSGGRAHHWPRHRGRLERACAVAALELPPDFLASDEAKLHAAVSRLLDEHGMTDAVFRYTVTGGRRELLALRPLPEAAPREGVCLRVLKLARDNGEWLPRPKSLNYLNASLGAQELRHRSPDTFDEGLFLSRDGGYAVETTRQNIAWIVDGILRHPDPALGAVEGTCLEWLLGLGVPAEVRRATVEELLAADALVLTNAVRGVTPVREIRDGGDRRLRDAMDSAGHPLVVSLMRQWNEGLESTARGDTAAGGKAPR